MLRLAAHEPAAAELLDAARSVCSASLINGLVTGTPADADYFSNAVAQPLICAATVATWNALRAHGLPEPVAVAGYSVGELSAHAIAGTLAKQADVIPLAKTRAEAMDAATAREGPSGLIAVRGWNAAEIEDTIRATGLEIAIVNGVEHFVLGGSEQMLSEGERRLAGSSTVRRLDVGVASHTSRLASAREAFHQALLAAGLRDPRRPVLAGIDGGVVRTATAAIDTLTAQISRTIRWDLCLRAAWELGARVFLTLGPGCGFARIALEALPAGCEARAADEFRSLAGVVAWVRGRLQV